MMMPFTKAITSFPKAIFGFYRNVFAAFRGRASRAEFWWPTLLLLVIYGVMASVLVGVYLELVSEYSEFREMPLLLDLSVLLWAALSFLSVLLFTVHLLPLSIVLVRRMHDCNFAGWWLWLLFLFDLIASGLEYLDYEMGAAFLWVISILAFLYWTCKPGDAGDNRFGPNPLAHTRTDTDADSTSNFQQTAEAN